MMKDNVQPDHMMYICLMSDAVACNDYTKAVFFFEELCEKSDESPAMRTFMTILRIYQKLGNWESAVGVISKLKKHGLSPDNLIMNNILGICITHGQVTTARKLLDEYRYVDGVLDVISFNTVLKGYAHMADLDNADALFQSMRDSGVEPSLISYNTLMDCSVRLLQARSDKERRRSKYGSGATNNGLV